MRLKELIVLKESYFTLNHIPVFLLDNQLTIYAQSDEFTTLPDSFFHVLLKPSKEISFAMIFTGHEIFIHFILPTAIMPIYSVCIGPILYNLPKNMINLDFLYTFQNGKIKKEQNVLKQLPQLDTMLYNNVQMMYSLLFEEKLTMKQFHDAFDCPQELKNREEFFNNVYHQREKDTQTNYSYHEELLMLEAIRNGDSAYARTYASKLAGGRIGHMSEDEFRNKKYAIVAGIALIARTTIDAGVNIENAYALSDVYIRKIDEAYVGKDLMHIFYDVIMDFCHLVQLRKYQDYPMWIRSCVQYIDQHLHTDISLDDLSEVVHLSPVYISGQFKKLVGKSIKQYLNEQKIYEAKFLLKTTDLSIQEIALTLNFGTQSYFTKVFKSITSTSPKVYQNAKKRS